MKSLKQRLAALRENIEKSLDNDALAIMHRATADLVANGLEDRVLAVDESMPRFELPDQHGELHRSETFVEGGPLIVTFYRGIWCPYCNLDLKVLETYQPRFRKAGATLVAISPELPEHSRQTAKRHRISFPILSDAGNEVASSFGLRFFIGEPLKQLYRDGFGIDLESFDGDASWTLPMPARFVVDRTGKVRYAEASADYTKRPEPDELLPVLESLSASENENVHNNCFRESHAPPLPAHPIRRSSSRRTRSSSRSSSG